MEKNPQIVRRNSVDAIKQLALLALCLLFLAAQFQLEVESAAILPASSHKSLVEKFENEDNERRAMSSADEFEMANLLNGVKFLQEMPEAEFGPSDEVPEQAALSMDKRNYQHIWRNVQMRMPVYSHNGQMSNSKRSMPGASNKVLRHQANTLYRLGRK